MNAKKTALASLLGALSAAPALACPVCFNAVSGEVREAYYLTTALLILLPIAILGSIGAWLYFAATRPTPCADSPECAGDGRAETRT